MKKLVHKMVKYCSVALCTNGTHNRADLSYFCFPKSVKIRRQWEAFSRRADRKFRNLTDPRICSLHFKCEDIRKGLSGKLSVLKGAIPSIFDPNKETSKENIRKDRMEKRTLRLEQSACQTNENPAKRNKIVGEDITDVPVNDSLTKPELTVDSNNLPYCDHDYTDRIDVVDASHKNVMCKTDLTMEDLEKMEEELQTFKAKLNAKSKQERKVDNSKQRREMVMEAVLKSDESVKFYTGIPSLSCFTLLLNTVLPYAEKMKYWDKNKCQLSYYQTDLQKKKPGRKRYLQVNEELILVLMRLKLGLLERHLADIFAVTKSTVSRVYITWVQFLALTFKGSLLRWPSKEEINAHMPASFSKYPGTRVIIDCTEFFIEKPSSPSAQKATWSDYKHHNTVKLLVGITPSGAFSFVSKLWSGSSSDRRVTQESGLLDLLEEGDHVMADRGFTVRDLLTKKGVKLNIPPFNKGNSIS